MEQTPRRLSRKTMKNLPRTILVIAIAGAIILIVLRSSQKSKPEAQVLAPVTSKSNNRQLSQSNEAAFSATPNPGPVKNPSALAPYLEIVEGKFGLVLSSFNIAPDRLARIKVLLAEREAAKADVTDLRGNKDPNVARDARGVFPKIDEGFRNEVQAALTSDEWQKVSRMLIIEANLTGLEHEYASPLILSGEALTGSQLFSIADKVHTIYGDGVGDLAKFTATIDPATHLTASNEAILSQLSGTLSPNQLSKLKANLVARNERLLGVAGINSKN